MRPDHRHTLSVLLLVQLSVDRKKTELLMQAKHVTDPPAGGPGLIDCCVQLCSEWVALKHLPGYTSDMPYEV